MPPPDGDICFCLWPENVPAYQLWHELQTQWRIAPDGRPTGLDYAGCAAHMRIAQRLRPRLLRERWDQIRAMEHGALRGLAEKRASAAVGVMHG